MAPKRRSTGSAAAAARPNQSTLTFNGRTSKVTKPSNPASSAKAKSSLLPPASKALPPPAESPATEAVEADTRAEATVLSQAESDAARVAARRTTAEEEAALAISEVQIKKYWRAKERERKVPRVHQEDVSLHERVLREWDISAQFGPSIGMTRLKRWQRAHKLGLRPPVEVLAVLLKEQETKNIRTQRSHVDELMNSRFIEA